MSNLSDKIKGLPPEKLDLLLRQLRPNVTSAAPQAAPDKRPFNPAEDENFCLVIKRPGLLESLTFRARSRFSPDATDPGSVLLPNGVEVEVRAAALNFRDVAVSLG